MDKFASFLKVMLDQKMHSFSRLAFILALYELDGGAAHEVKAHIGVQSKGWMRRVGNEMTTLGLTTMEAAPDKKGRVSNIFRLTPLAVEIAKFLPISSKEALGIGKQWGCSLFSAFIAYQLFCNSTMTAGNLSTLLNVRAANYAKTLCCNGLAESMRTILMDGKVSYSYCLTTKGLEYIEDVFKLDPFSVEVKGGAA